MEGVKRTTYPPASLYDKIKIDEKVFALDSVNNRGIEETSPASAQNPSTKNSLRNKLHLLESILITPDPHVFIISETGFHDGVQDSEIIPSSYKLIRKDRTTRSGGEAIAIKNNLKFTRPDDIDVHESVFCTITYHGKFIFLGGVYRPPNAPTEYLEVMHDYIVQRTNSCKE